MNGCVFNTDSFCIKVITQFGYSFAWCYGLNVCILPPPPPTHTHTDKIIC